MSRRDGGNGTPRSDHQPTPRRSVPDGLSTDRRTFIGTVTALGVLHTVAGTTVAGDPPPGVVVGEAVVVGYGEGGFGEGGFGGVAAEAPVTATVTISGPGEAEVGTPVELDIHVQNTGSSPDEPVRLMLVFHRDGGISPGDVKLELRDGAGAEWVPSQLTPTDTSLVGWYGDEAGFELSAGYDESFEVRLTVSTVDVFQLATVVIGVGDLSEEYAVTDHALVIEPADLTSSPTPVLTPTPSPTPTSTPAPDDPDSIPGPGLLPTLATVAGVGYVLKWLATRRSAIDDQ